jgi:hypothetical protein
MPMIEDPNSFPSVDELPRNEYFQAFQDLVNRTANLKANAAIRTTWAGRPDAAAYPAAVLLVLDIGVGGSFWISDGADWVPLEPITLANQNAANRNYDTAIQGTSDYTHFQLVIPGMAMPKSGTLEVLPIWTHPNSATTKNLKVMIGATQLYNKSRTTTALEAPQIEMIARGARNSHLVPFNSTGLYAVANAGAVSTSSVDMSVDQTLTIVSSWGTAGTGTNNIALERVRVRIIP